MWYLIAPPFIVILSLAFLVWFLARRASEPSVVERMELLSAQQEGSFELSKRLKRFFFRILDRLMHSLKVSTLRMHNLFHSAGQGIKRHRSTLEKMITSENGSSPSLLDGSSTTELPRETSRRSFFSFSRKSEFRVDAPSDQNFSGTPVVEKPFFSRKRKIVQSEEIEVVDRDELEQFLNEKEVVLSDSLSNTSIEQSVPEVIPPRKSEEELRPMVAEQMAVPESLERQRERERENAIREEALIKKIAANPKSVSGYESLGDFYFEMGNVNDAKSCYRQVLKLSPVHRSVKMKIRRLERMIEGKS